LIYAGSTLEIAMKKGQSVRLVSRNGALARA
jgi:hypothetical protein